MLIYLWCIYIYGGVFNRPNLRRYSTACINKVSFKIFFFFVILHVFCNVCCWKLQPGRMTLLFFFLLVNPMKGRFF